MKLNKKLITLASVGAMIALCSFSFQFTESQQEKKPTNLKVLPKNISHDELIAVMKDFNVALGVKCGFCHAPSAENPKSMDFASDANRHKEVARHMMRMTNKINKKYFNKENREGKIKAINCATCHNGEKHPKMALK